MLQWPIRDFYEFEGQSWFIQCSDELLKERGEFGPRRGTPIGRDSVVSVEKDPRTRSLRFRVDGIDLVDQDGTPYGWRHTGLEQSAFDSLVGAIQMDNKGTEVEIVD